ncbi:YidB family protein [Neorhizobium sp. NCHU2750]|uniref:YidB family protein n=1 Tax=Neorhizobium sp. NCHU2750 TaxID=1825976 RepID=UPI000E70E4C2|nr:hypothetical protein NCHU2750_12990 [Neorhizobium sp. NCHU2750]
MVSGQLKALLGVLAVAGYQNRDKIADFLRGIQSPQPQGSGATPETTEARSGGLGDILGSLTGGPGGGGGSSSGAGGGLGGLLGGLGGLTSGGILSGGLGDLLDTFQQNGHGDKAKSWVEPGANAEIAPDQLSQAIGPGVLEELAEKTGLSTEEILARLSRDLPKAVDDLTPDGRLPAG